MEVLNLVGGNGWRLEVKGVILEVKGGCGIKRSGAEGMWV